MRPFAPLHGDAVTRETYHGGVGHALSESCSRRPTGQLRDSPLPPSRPYWSVPTALSSVIQNQIRLTGPLLPFERLLHESDIARVGLCRCHPDDPLFRNPGPTWNHSFVFPRTAVRLQRGGAVFVSDPTGAGFYNCGDEYVREALSALGDECDWFAVAPDVLIEAVYRDGRPADGRRPFSMTFTNAPPRVCLEARSLIARLECHPDLEPLYVDEAVLGLLDALLLPGTRPEAAATDSQRRLAARVREVVARHFAAKLSLGQLSADCGASPWFLAKLFKRVTGMTIHSYQRQLRLRASLQYILDGEDLTAVALDLGFSSHSHFTAAFRQVYQMTPTAFRRAARSR